jgi:predicted Zn-dependent peptidase
MSDCGVFAIYFGCDADDTNLCKRLIDRTVEKLASERLSERRFASIVRQHIGQMTLGAENKENTIMSMARAVLYRGKVESLQNIVSHISNLQPEDLRLAAEMISPERLSMLTFC